MSPTLFDIKWSAVDFPNCAASHVRIGNSHCVSETIDTCLHWKQTRGHCKKWRENGCGDESHQLRQYRHRRSTWSRYGLVHLSEVGIVQQGIRICQVLAKHRNRTIARAEQLEAEERSSLRQSVARGEGYGEFSDEPEDEAAAATVLRNDDLDFFDDTDTGDAGGYRDDTSGAEQDVFRHGDGDEEGSIGLGKQNIRI